MDFKIKIVPICQLLSAFLDRYYYHNVNMHGLQFRILKRLEKLGEANIQTDKPHFHGLRITASRNST